jgi:hypothetical protein
LYLGVNSGPCRGFSPIGRQAQGDCHICKFISQLNIMSYFQIKSDPDPIFELKTDLK